MYRDGEPRVGGAYHDYVGSFGDSLSEGGEDGARIQFQRGSHKDPESRNGVCNADLLEIVRNQLRAFQAGPFSCRENDCALTHGKRQCPLQSK